METLIKFVTMILWDWWCTFLVLLVRGCLKVYTVTSWAKLKDKILSRKGDTNVTCILAPQVGPQKGQIWNPVLVSQTSTVYFQFTKNYDSIHLVVTVVVTDSNLQLVLSEVESFYGYWKFIINSSDLSSPSLNPLGGGGGGGYLSHFFFIAFHVLRLGHPC